MANMVERKHTLYLHPWPSNNAVPFKWPCVNFCDDEASTLARIWSISSPVLFLLRSCRHDGCVAINYLCTSRRDEDIQHQPWRISQGRTPSVAILPKLRKQEQKNSSKSITVQAESVEWNNVEDHSVVPRPSLITTNDIIATMISKRQQAKPSMTLALFPPSSPRTEDSLLGTTDCVDWLILLRHLCVVVMAPYDIVAVVFFVAMVDNFFAFGFYCCYNIRSKKNERRRDESISRPYIPYKHIKDSSTSAGARTTTDFSAVWDDSQLNCTANTFISVTTPSHRTRGRQ